MTQGPKNPIMKKAIVQDPHHKMKFGPSGHRLFPKNVFLVGLRGSGKSILGGRMAGLLGKGFADMDEIIAYRADQTIAELVADKGWDAFRALESEVLADLCQDEDRFVATGGGVVLAEENRKLLAENGTVFYLHAKPEVLLPRLAANPGAESRPPLGDASPEDEMAQAYAERDPLYREIADYVIEADVEPRVIGAQILDTLRRLAQGG